jgi:pimeloyl-ACP methyl ester carboxylesterase
MTSRDRIFHLKGGRTIGYCEYGDPKGKPLFYFHGWPSSRLSGAETDTAAKKLHIRVISPDRPGFGLSDFQSNRTLLDWPADVEEIADQLHIKKFSVMGVSGGGPYAAACAYKIPKRIIKTGIVVGLAPIVSWDIMDGMFFSSKFSWYTYHRFPFMRTIGAFVSALIFSYFPRIGRSVGFQSPADRLLLKTVLKEKEFDACKEAFRQGRAGAAHDLKVYTDDWGFDLRDIQTPVYLWYGAKDQNVSLNMGKYYRDHIPESTLFIDADGGHLSRNQYEEKILKTLTTP